MSSFLQLCDLLKSKVESPNFLEKLGCSHQSVLQNVAGKHNAKPTSFFYCAVFVIPKSICKALFKLCRLSNDFLSSNVEISAASTSIDDYSAYLFITCFVSSYVEVFAAMYNARYIRFTFNLCKHFALLVLAVC